MVLNLVSSTLPCIRQPRPRLRPFGARGRSSVQYGTRLGDLKNKQPTHTGSPVQRLCETACPRRIVASAFYLIPVSLRPVLGSRPNLACWIRRRILRILPGASPAGEKGGWVLLKTRTFKAITQPHAQLTQVQPRRTIGW